MILIFCIQFTEVITRRVETVGKVIKATELSSLKVILGHPGAPQLPQRVAREITFLRAIRRFKVINEVISNKNK